MYQNILSWYFFFEWVNLLWSFLLTSLKFFIALIPASSSSQQVPFKDIEKCSKTYSQYECYKWVFSRRKTEMCFYGCWVVLSSLPWMAINTGYRVFRNYWLMQNKIKLVISCKKHFQNVLLLLLASFWSCISQK